MNRASGLVPSKDLKVGGKPRPWWRSKTISHSAGAIGLVILGALLHPAGERLVGHLYPAAPASCSNDAQYLTNDYGSNSGLRLQLRASSSSGCFTAKGTEVLEGQNFSGFLEWRNRSEGRQDNVSLKMLLPDGVTLMPGTSVLVNGKDTEGAEIGDGLGASTGINLGSYGPGASFFIQFTLHFSAAPSVTCGRNVMPISAYRFAFEGPQLHESVPITHLVAC